MATWSTFSSLNGKQPPAALVAKDAPLGILGPAVGAETGAGGGAGTADQGQRRGGQLCQAALLHLFARLRVHCVDTGAAGAGSDVLDVVAEDRDEEQVDVLIAFAEAEAPPSAPGADRRNVPQLLHLAIAAHNEKQTPPLESTGSSIAQDGGPRQTDFITKGSKEIQKVKLRFFYTNSIGLMRGFRTCRIETGAP